MVGRLNWLALGVLACAFWAAESRAAPPENYELVVDKSERRLWLKHGEAIAQEYRIAHGRGGRGDKVRNGDRRTPVGVYRIVNFKEDSDFYFFMQINYPNVKDAFYGLKNQLISRPEFDRIVYALRRQNVPPQDTALGGYIGIHGIGEVTPDKLQAHDQINWTEGCIALTNDQITELKRFVHIGTKVTIRE